MDPNQNSTNFEFYFSENLRSRHEYEEAMYVTPLYQLSQEVQSELETQNTRTKKKNYVGRDRHEAHNILFKDYFADDATFTEDQFRRRFRRNKKVFMRIVNDLSCDEYFTLRYNAAKQVGLSPIQKCTTAMRMLPYEMPGDAYDKYVKIGLSTAIECLKRFCDGVVHLYEGIYLRKPNGEDLERLLRVVEDRGFSGMIGSIDYMHWEWKKCPVGWQRQFTGGHQGTATVILEAIASFRSLDMACILWIAWYSK
ncbi:hypothetical protein LIER_07396 [Lithospermum erythrorhizon]|uniref:Uncharacterized protein n=1 Tax=Lithospermum erythrorhizon TaxID=34254 RepID=A0AAV3P997_LITER